jgi:hypothetical protein
MFMTFQVDSFPQVSQPKVICVYWCGVIVFIIIIISSSSSSSSKSSSSGKSSSSLQPLGQFWQEPETS